MQKVDWEPLQAWAAHNRGRLIGGGMGLFIGTVVLAVGFWRGMFLAFCVWLGWFLGSRLDAHETITDLINRLFPPGE